MKEKNGPQILDATMSFISKETSKSNQFQTISNSQQSMDALASDEISNEDMNEVVEAQ